MTKNPRSMPSVGLHIIDNAVFIVWDFMISGKNKDLK